MSEQTKMSTQSKVELWSIILFGLLLFAYIISLPFLSTEYQNKKNNPPQPYVYYKYQIQMYPRYCNGPFTNVYWEEYDDESVLVLHWIDEQGIERTKHNPKYVIEEWDRVYKEK